MASREQKWIQVWKDRHAFEPSKLSSEKKFFFTVPYAYPTGPLHVGHGRTYTNGDVMARVHRMRGENVLWPMGFHVTGTPILAISDAIKRGDVETKKLYADYVGIYEKDSARVQSIVESFVDPQNVAAFFAVHVREDLEKIGCSIDWRSVFSTMDAEYQQFVQWQFKKLFTKGVLVKGKYPILYSSVDKNAVGEDDIKDGDTDKVQIQEFTLVKFKIAGESTFLVASTLRPETLMGCTNLWVNPAVEYVTVQIHNEKWIVAKKALEKLGLQGKSGEHESPLDVSVLLAQHVENPLDASKKIPILPAPSVNAEKGTGIVYSVPGHAPFDFMALNELLASGNPVAQGLKPIHIIDTPDLGKMEDVLAAHKATSTQHREGLQAATEEIYKKEHYQGKLNQHNGPLSNLPVEAAKKRVLTLLGAQNKVDSLYEPSRKALTRAGNPVSVAVLGDQWFLDYSSKEWKDKTHALLDKMTLYPEHFRKSISEAIDWLDRRPCIRKRGLGTPFPFAPEWMIEPLSDSTIYMLYYLAIPHIRNAQLHNEQLDEAFFDSAFLGKKLPSNDTRTKTAEAIFADMRYWYPLDLQHTAPAHISNHAAFLMFTHTLLFDEKFWPRAFTFNELLIRNGQKMSKSKGNVIPIQTVVDEVGTDLMRLFIVSSAGMERTADWKDNQVPQVRAKLNELEQTLVRALDSTESKLSPEQRWLVESLQKKLGEGHHAYETYDFMGAAQKIFFETQNEIKRFKKVFPQDERPAVKTILREWLTLITPITPFLAEEVNEKFGGKILASHLTLPHAPKGNPSAEIEARVQFLENVLQDVERVRKMVKGKQPKTLFLYSADAGETKWLGEAAPLIQKHVNFQVKVNDSHDPLGKMQKAAKGRPALYLE